GRCSFTGPYSSYRRCVLSAMFALAIKDHLELQRRNRELETDMPLAAYRDGGAVEAVELGDTQEWVMTEMATVLAHDEPLSPRAEDLWTATPAFDWGD